MENFDFQNPELLWLLLLLPILMILRGRSGKAASIVFSSTAIAQNVSRSTKSSAGGILFSLRILALVLIIIALARPRIGHGYEEETSSGIDIALVVDISRSMSALDLAENANLKYYKSVEELQEQTRISVVKRVLEKFIDKRKSDRLGLIAFAAAPYLVSPLTLNHDWLIKNLKSQINIGRIDANSTAIGDALAMSVNRLRDLKNVKSRIIILLTDGENTGGSIPPQAAAEAAASYKTKVYTILAGRDGPTYALNLDDNGNVARDMFGRVVSQIQNQVNPETLMNIAEATGGKFYQASNPKQLASIYDEIDQLEKTEIKIKKYQNYDELYHWFAMAALAFLLLEHLLSNTKLKRLP